MKRKTAVVIICIILLVCLVPIPNRLKDGGSLQLTALLYKFTKYRQINRYSETGYVEGIGLDILGIKVLDTRKMPNENENSQIDVVVNYQNISEIKQDDIDKTMLFKFDGVVYGQSFDLIDYAGTGEVIGKIEKFIDSQYIPKIDGETNNKVLVGGLICEKTDKSVIVNYDNTYTLFYKVDGIEQTEDISSDVAINQPSPEVTAFEEKNINKIEVLERESESNDGKPIYNNSFTVKATLQDKQTIEKMSGYLFGDAINKSEGSWVKFNPARANYYALKLYCSDGSNYIINIHFSKGEGIKYVAVAYADTDVEYNAFVNQENADAKFERCIANKEFGEFLINMF